jgi:catechol 2,3-dioxygenase-like lactoylglutathione lyase family enzyme
MMEEIQLRCARHTTRLDELVRFYRDGIGLQELGSFHAHEGYDGVFLGVPGTSSHLEFTSGGGHAAPEPHPETLLVFYMGSDEAVARARTRVGSPAVEAANPYWTRNGVTLEDPDGFRVVLVPRAWPGS